MSPVKTLTLNDGNKIPIIAFGTGSALYGRDATPAGTQALQAGFIHLDSAQMYKNEPTLGRAIAQVDRSSIFITTKLGEVPKGETIRDTLIRSCKDLQVDYVDLFLIHTPKLLSGLRISEAWTQLEELKQEGLAKSIGVSNFRIEDLEELLSQAKVVPAVNQIEYHVYTAKSAAPLLEFHKKHNIVTEAFGGLTPIVRAKGGAVDPILAKIRQRLVEATGDTTITDGQVLLKWLEAKDIVAVTTTSKKERLEEYLATQSLPELTAQEVQEIGEAGGEKHHRHYQMMSHMDATVDN